MDGNDNTVIIAKLEQEINQILFVLGMNPVGRRDHMYLRDAILIAVCYPVSWKDNYLGIIGEREGITRERIRQMLHKAVWDNWRRNSKSILTVHFGSQIKTEFEYVKPNHVEFVNLISEKLRERINSLIN